MTLQVPLLCLKILAFHVPYAKKYASCISLMRLLFYLIVKMSNSNLSFFAKYFKYWGLIFIFGPLLYVSYLLVVLDNNLYWCFIFYNYRVFFVMPYSAFFAYYLVATLEASRGPIIFEFWRLKLQGASGPLLFWLLIFWTIMFFVRSFWSGLPPVMSEQCIR